MNELDHTSYERAEEENRPISNARLAVLVLLGAEIMFFAGLIGTFLVFRFGSVTWPPPSQADVRLPIGVTGLNTIVLLLSGYTMFQGLRAIRQDRQRELKNWLFATGTAWCNFPCGARVRMGALGASWIYAFIRSIRLSFLRPHRLSRFACSDSSPLAVSRLSLRTIAGRFSVNHYVGVEVCAIYWAFVVVLWPLLYVLVYLI